MSEMKPYPDAPEMTPGDNAMSYLYRWHRFAKAFNLTNAHNNANFETDFDALWDKIRDAIYETPAVDGLLSDLNWEEAGLIADSVIKVLETNNKEATND